jgi:hypothetical protein
MPGQDYPDHQPEGADTPLAQMVKAPTSRRSLLRSGVGLSAIGLAVAAGGGGTVAALLSSQSQGDATQSAADAASSGPIVIYIADPKSGEMDIFAGTSKTHTRNQAMASTAASLAPR